MFSDRVLSGMRPTGRMHIGHYHGALKNWLRLQEEYDCLYFAADWHALTTHYETPERIEDSVWEMFIDWLAAGINPTRSTIFIQSRVVEHAELTLLLGMMAPVGWLERVPTYKEQQQKLADRDLTTFGFLGYPVMQEADILIYRANRCRSVKTRSRISSWCGELASVQPIYCRTRLRGEGEDGDQEARIEACEALRAAPHRVPEQGDQAALETAREMLTRHEPGTGRPRAPVRLPRRLARVILPEPHPLLTDTPKVPGTDGQKMSKSYDNAIYLREDPATITTKVRTMQTDPARVHRSDPGTPEKCPVWSLHQIYSDQTTRDWAHNGCTTAGIGCLDCKQPVIDAIIAEQRPLHERAQKYLDDPSLVRAIVADGCERARKLAEETMRDVRDAMGLSYT
jgi:tryptophanyl-tRNA synthetase